MISDDRLKKIAESVAVQEYDSAYVALGDVKDMAQELLQRREAERNAKSWENAPEWAQYRITTHEGIQRYFENDPIPDDFGDFYSEGGRISIIMVDNWEDSVEERPR